MADALIENPILNSPFHEPDRHFKFTDEGITNEIVPGRRSSSYFIPIARPKKKGKQLAFDTEWTQDRIEENKTVNRIRQRVGMWREGGYVAVSPTTAGLLRYWTEVTGEKKKDKGAKVMTARTLWIPAVNNHGGFGRWRFLEVDDPYNALGPIRSILAR